MRINKLTDAYLEELYNLALKDEAEMSFSPTLLAKAKAYPLKQYLIDAKKKNRLSFLSDNSQLHYQSRKHILIYPKDCPFLVLDFLIVRQHIKKQVDILTLQTCLLKNTQWIVKALVNGHKETLSLPFKAIMAPLIGLKLIAELLQHPQCQQLKPTQQKLIESCLSRLKQFHQQIFHQCYTGFIFLGWLALMSTLLFSAPAMVINAMCISFLTGFIAATIAAIYLEKQFYQALNIGHSGDMSKKIQAMGLFKPPSDIPLLEQPAGLIKPQKTKINYDYGYDQYFTPVAEPTTDSHINPPSPYVGLSN